MGRMGRTHSDQYTAAGCSLDSYMPAVGHSGSSGRNSAGTLGTAGTAGTGEPTTLGQAPKKEHKPRGSLLA